MRLLLQLTAFLVSLSKWLHDLSIKKVEDFINAEVEAAHQVVDGAEAAYEAAVNFLYTAGADLNAKRLAANAKVTEAATKIDAIRAEFKI